MRIFVTGASGWIGTPAVDQLLRSGHDVVALARSEASAAALRAEGVSVRRGELDDLDSLRSGAEDSDAVVHLANKHDFARPAVSNAAERAAVETFGEALAGSDRPFVLASGVLGSFGRPSTEHDPSPFHGPDAPRGGAENRALDFLARGVKVVIVRFAPSVHGDGDYGLVPMLVELARTKGLSGYVGDGSGRWPAVHRLDAGRVVALGVDGAEAGQVLHAIAEEGVPTRSIAEAIGRGLGVPVGPIAPADAMAHFGWLGGLFGLDVVSSSALTQKALGWTPSGPTLLDDLSGPAYFRL
ncbi:SDR family oxidoreductase [Lapillicoccus sp.]|uniref:SDR family oxidoreductase n=1 Tax=Lapillicoccus sp. TaxID=1909287 RepID=UPI0025DA864A|nr:SDR family oxidoreductase [Lapillicoccus sp.]